jgi:multidrug efflux pump
MNISKHFIDRPVLASMLSALILLAGAMALFRLPVAEYPEVVPPSIIVKASFPGANPKVISETVSSPLEEAINGVDGMLYMSSQATTDGNLTLTVTFRLGTDADKAQQLVQSRVAQSLPHLPADVQRQGVTTVKSSTDVTLLVHLVSPSGRYDMAYLSNYAILKVRDRLARIKGVAAVPMFGASDYAMRIWLDPGKVAQRGLTASDVVRAIRAQNIQVAAGVVGASPGSPEIALQLPVNAKGRLQNEAEFGAIVLSTTSDGAVTYLRDVARIQLGLSDYSLRAWLDNQPAVALPVMRAPGSNALDISTQVRTVMEELKHEFPEGLAYRIAYDPTQFVRASIHAVIVTLLEAVLLVSLVVVVFLQTWRAVMIPLLAVPISIIGTFSLMLAFGFSINTLSLFGLVLAIGIVVDDAIVVVENVQRHIAAGLPPRQAAHRAMEEVSGPIIAIGLTLVSVFLPLGLMPGLTGEFYKQFALTIAISTIISAFNSLTLSPALCALLLKPTEADGPRSSNVVARLWHGFSSRFNAAFEGVSHRHASGVRWAIQRKGFMLVLYAVLLGGAAWLVHSVPGGFVPAQDKQYLVGFAQLQNGASLDRTDAVVRQMSDIALRHPGIESAIAFPGMSINGFSNSSSAGIVFAMLKPFSERTDSSLSASAIAQSLNGQYAARIGEAYTAIFPPPPVNGLGTVGGFKLQLEDQAELGYRGLYEVTQAFIKEAATDPVLSPLFSSYQINVPQLDADVDRVRAAQLGVPVNEVFETMQIYLGSLYVNDFNRFGRTYQVRVQADTPFRARPDDILQLKTRGPSGAMVPLASLASVAPGFGPEMVTRYNGFTSSDLNGGPAPGYSSDQAQAAIERIAQKVLPKGVRFEWTDLTYQQVLAGNTAAWMFPLSVLLVFMVLAAQYESLTLPLAIILIVPLSILAALGGVWMMGGDNNVFTQIGLIVLCGLASKNAILIVEFARELEREGRSPVQAAIKASHLRLRPILMTSIAFIMGVLPLVLSSGAGSEMRQAMGLAVFWGMLGVTAFGLFLTPVFYVLLRWRAQLTHTARSAVAEPAGAV